MTDAEIAEVGRGVQLVPLTAGAVVLAYNLPALQADLKLSREAYSGIFLGEITQWNDPRIVATNPDLKNLADHRPRRPPRPQRHDLRPDQPLQRRQLNLRGQVRGRATGRLAGRGHAR